MKEEEQNMLIVTTTILTGLLANNDDDTWREVQEPAREHNPGGTTMNDLTPITFDESSRRFCIGDHELHCGEVFELHHPRQKFYLQVRIEHADFWYLISDFGNITNFGGLPAKLL